jgi:hypothetical protein|tara:strand:+ start:1750 stop:2079 length:330 start_codon:yes stop_codon:yes gene_type:complete
METYLFFMDGVENSVLFPASKLMLVDAADDKVTCYFEGIGIANMAFQKVDVNCAADKSGELAKQIGDAVAAASVSRKGRVITVADNVNGIFLGNATSCGGITLDVTPGS